MVNNFKQATLAYGKQFKIEWPKVINGKLAKNKQ